jgi:DNA-binding NarL/FixJ family response regulator
MPSIDARDGSIKLILMDIDLGRGMDGPEAARRILALRRLPIVFCTSHSEKEYVDRVKEITRYGYIIKNSGDFVLRSSIEMAFELFDAHDRVQSNLNRISLEIAEIARRLEEAQAASGDPSTILEDALEGLVLLVDSLRQSRVS